MKRNSLKNYAFDSSTMALGKADAFRLLNGQVFDKRDSHRPILSSLPAFAERHSYASAVNSVIQGQTE